MENNYYCQPTSQRKPGKTYTKRFLAVCLVLLSALFGLRAQTAQFTYPVNGQVITDMCDFHFCVNNGILNGWHTITLGKATFNAGEDDVFASFYPNANGATICSYVSQSPLNLYSGAQTFYLYDGDHTLIDSVNINTSLPLPTISVTRNTNNPALNDIIITNLPSVFTASLYPTSYNTPPIILNSGISTYSTTAPINSGTGHVLLKANYCIGNPDDVYEHYVNPVPSTCANYNLPYQFFNFTSNMINCVQDTVFVNPVIRGPETIWYNSQTDEGKTRFILNWGDGNIDTTLFFNNDIGISSEITGHAKHKYTAPGVYQVLIMAEGDNTCFNAVYTESVTVSQCGNITGNIYNDVDNDCNITTGDFNLLREQVQLFQGSTLVTSAWTDTNGNYSLKAPAGTYLIKMGPSGYVINCGNSLPHTVTVSTNATSVENFALNCDGTYDIAATGAWVNPTLFPGTTSYIYPYVGIYNGTCSFPSTPSTVKMVLSSCLSYDANATYQNNNGPDQVIPSPTGDTLVWNTTTLNGLGNFNYWDYAAAVTTCTNAQVGDTACVTIIVAPTANDSDPSNNIITSCFAIGVSYDPNNKEVLPRGEGPNGNVLPTTDKFTYTLNFQNTGTAPAHNIYLLDTLSANFDLSTLEIISASHPMQPYLLADNTMKFMFANIMLPDSTHNEARSHGYVTYSIKPKTNLPLGTQFKNTGYIYFDYNAPVVTNTTINTFAIPTGITKNTSNELFKVYPNPANDRVFVKTNQLIGGTIEVIDILGKQVKQVKSIGLQTEINVMDLQNGVYFIKVTNNTQSYTEKVMINK